MLISLVVLETSSKSTEVQQHLDPISSQMAYLSVRPLHSPISYLHPGSYSTVQQVISTLAATQQSNKLSPPFQLIIEPGKMFLSKSQTVFENLIGVLSKNGFQGSQTVAPSPSFKLKK